MTADAAEKWLEQNAIRCERFEMRLSPATCETYRRERPLRCQGCARAEGAPPAAVDTEEARKAGARRTIGRDIRFAQARRGARKTKEKAMPKVGTCACGCGKSGKIMARGLLAGCYEGLRRKGGLERFATRYQASDHLPGAGEKVLDRFAGAGQMVIVDDDFGREGAAPARLPEAGNTPTPAAPPDAPKAKRSHTRGACRCCGQEGPLYGRGLVKSCYQRHDRAGTLDQFPPLIDSAQAKARRARAEAATYEGSAFAVDLDAVLAGVRAVLLAKNAAYGDSALNPVRVFSKVDPLEQINVRLDDKLSRLMRGEDAGEDTEGDLLGYLVLKRVAMRRAVA